MKQEDIKPAAPVITIILFELQQSKQNSPCLIFAAHLGQGIWFTSHAENDLMQHTNCGHPDWVRPKKNHEVFGKCANENWHGHNYELFVTIKGEPDPDTGFVLDLKYMSDVIREEVVEKLDHKNLNLDVPFMKGLMSSTENLAIQVWNILEKTLNDGRAILHCVKIVETENNFVEYFGK